MLREVGKVTWDMLVTAWILRWYFFLPRSDRSRVLGQWNHTNMFWSPGGSLEEVYTVIKHPEHMALYNMTLCHGAKIIPFPTRTLQGH